MLFFVKVGSPRLNWQADLAFLFFNLYRGSLALLRSGGDYSQAPGSNPYAARFCDLGSTLIDDPVAMRDAYAAGDIHIGWATLDMIPLLLDGLKKDYGIGFRLHGPAATSLRSEFAKSNEGLALVFSAHASF